MRSLFIVALVLALFGSLIVACDDTVEDTGSVDDTGADADWCAEWPCGGI